VRPNGVPRPAQYAEKRSTLVITVSKSAPTRTASTVSRVMPSSETASEKGSAARVASTRGVHTVPLVVTSHATVRPSSMIRSQMRWYSGTRNGSPPRKRAWSRLRRKGRSWSKKSSP
jgi:hypothetical protein